MALKFFTDLADKEQIKKAAEEIFPDDLTVDVRRKDAYDPSTAVVLITRSDGKRLPHMTVDYRGMATTEDVYAWWYSKFKQISESVTMTQASAVNE